MQLCFRSSPPSFAAILFLLVLLLSSSFLASARVITPAEQADGTSLEITRGTFQGDQLLQIRGCALKQIIFADDALDAIGSNPPARRVDILDSVVEETRLARVGKGATVLFENSFLKFVGSAREIGFVLHENSQLIIRGCDFSRNFFDAADSRSIPNVNRSDFLFQLELIDYTVRGATVVIENNVFGDCSPAFCTDFGPIVFHSLKIHGSLDFIVVNNSFVRSSARAIALGITVADRGSDTSLQPWCHVHHAMRFYGLSEAEAKKRCVDEDGLQDGKLMRGALGVNISNNIVRDTVVDLSADTKPVSQGVINIFAGEPHVRTAVQVPSLAPGEPPFLTEQLNLVSLDTFVVANNRLENFTLAARTPIYFYIVYLLLHFQFAMRNISVTGNNFTVQREVLPVDDIDQAFILQSYHASSVKCVVLDIRTTQVTVAGQFSSWENFRSIVVADNHLVSDYADVVEGVILDSRRDGRILRGDSIVIARNTMVTEICDICSVVAFVQQNPVIILQLVDGFFFLNNTGVILRALLLVPRDWEAPVAPTMPPEFALFLDKLRNETGTPEKLERMRALVPRLEAELLASGVRKGLPQEAYGVRLHDRTVDAHLRGRAISLPRLELCDNKILTSTQSDSAAPVDFQWNGATIEHLSVTNNFGVCSLLPTPRPFVGANVFGIRIYADRRKLEQQQQSPPSFPTVAPPHAPSPAQQRIEITGNTVLLHCPSGAVYNDQSFSALILSTENISTDGCSTPDIFISNNSLTIMNVSLGDLSASGSCLGFFSYHNSVLDNPIVITGNTLSAHFWQGLRYASAGIVFHFSETNITGGRGTIAIVGNTLDLSSNFAAMGVLVYAIPSPIDPNGLPVSQKFNTEKMQLEITFIKRGRLVADGGGAAAATTTTTILPSPNVVFAPCFNISDNEFVIRATAPDTSTAAVAFVGGLMSSARQFLLLANNNISLAHEDLPPLPPAPALAAGKGLHSGIVSFFSTSGLENVFVGRLMGRFLPSSQFPLSQIKLVTFDSPTARSEFLIDSALLSAVDFVGNRVTALSGSRVHSLVWTSEHLFRVRLGTVNISDSDVSIVGREGDADADLRVADFAAHTRRSNETPRVASLHYSGGNISLSSPAAGCTVLDPVERGGQVENVSFSGGVLMQLDCAKGMRIIGTPQQQQNQQPNKLSPLLCRLNNISVNDANFSFVHNAPPLSPILDHVCHRDGSSSSASALATISLVNVSLLEAAAHTAPGDATFTVVRDAAVDGHCVRYSDKDIRSFAPPLFVGVGRFEDTEYRRCIISPTATPSATKSLEPECSGLRVAWSEEYTASARRLALGGRSSFRLTLIVASEDDDEPSDKRPASANTPVPAGQPQSDSATVFAVERWSRRWLGDAELRAGAGDGGGGGDLGDVQRQQLLDGLLAVTSPSSRSSSGGDKKAASSPVSGKIKLPPRNPGEQFPPIHPLNGDAFLLRSLSNSASSKSGVFVVSASPYTRRTISVTLEGAPEFDPLTAREITFELSLLSMQCRVPIPRDVQIAQAEFEKNINSNSNQADPVSAFYRTSSAAWIRVTVPLVPTAPTFFIPSLLQRVVATTSTTLVYAASALSVRPSPTTALRLVRASSVREQMQCGRSDLEPVAPTENPFGLGFGPRHGHYLRGTIVGFFVVMLVIVPTMFLMSALLLRYLRARFSDKKKKNNNNNKKQQEQQESSLRDELFQLGVPGKFLIPLAILCGATVSSAVSFAHDEQRFYTAGEKILAAAVFLFVGSVTLWMAHVIFVQLPRQQREGFIVFRRVDPTETKIQQVLGATFVESIESVVGDCSDCMEIRTEQQQQQQQQHQCSTSPRRRHQRSIVPRTHPAFYILQLQSAVFYAPTEWESRTCSSNSNNNNNFAEDDDHGNDNHNLLRRDSSPALTRHNNKKQNPDPHFIARTGESFDPCVATMPWYQLFEWTLSLSIAIAGGFRPPPLTASCNVLRAVITVLSVLPVPLFIFAPYRQRYDNGACSITNGLLALQATAASAAVLADSPFSTAVLEVFEMAVQVVCSVRSMLDLWFFVSQLQPLALALLELARHLKQHARKRGKAKKSSKGAAGQESNNHPASLFSSEVVGAALPEEEELVELPLAEFEDSRSLRRIKNRNSSSRSFALEKNLL